MFYSMANTAYNSTQDTNIKLQSLKGRTKLKFYKNISNYCDEVNNRRHSGTFQFEEDPFSKSAEGIWKIYDEVLLLVNFLRTKAQIKNMNINFYDLYYSVIKIRDDKKIVEDKYDNNENDYINLNDFLTTNHYIGINIDKSIR